MYKYIHIMYICMCVCIYMSCQYVSITYILTPRKFDDKIWYLKNIKRLFFDIIEKKYVCINKLL